MTITTECKTCGKEFSYAKTRGPLRTYCTELCRDQRTNMTEVKEVTLTCRHCCREFSHAREPGVRGPNPKHCSTQCKIKSRLRTVVINLPSVDCENCGVAFKRVHPSLKVCSRECHLAKKRIIKNKVIGHAKCEQCGEQFGVTINRRRFCNKKCARAARNRPAPTARELLESERFQRIKSKKRKCIRCSHVYLQINRQRASFCVACKAVHWKRTPPNPEGYVYCCEQCGRMVVRRKMAGRIVVCVACSYRTTRDTKTEAKRRREYLKRSTSNHKGKTFRRSDIFKRDGYTCQLCNCAVRQTKEYAPDQATIDHIIPLSRGGPHTMENCQCACQACNWAKNDSMPDRGGCVSGVIFQ